MKLMRKEEKICSSDGDGALGSQWVRCSQASRNSPLQLVAKRVGVNSSSVLQRNSRRTPSGPLNLMMLLTGRDISSDGAPCNSSEPDFAGADVVSMLAGSGSDSALNPLFSKKERAVAWLSVVTHCS